MPWTRIDDRFPHHPKVVKAGVRAGFLFVAGLVYCATYRTDGFIPKEALPILAPLRDYKRLARRLVEVRAPGGEHGLWEEVEGGFLVHDYLDYQMSADDMRAREEADKARLRAARARGNQEASASEDASVGATSPRRRPVPSPSPNQIPSPNPTPPPIDVTEEPRTHAHGEETRAEDREPPPSSEAAAILEHLTRMAPPIAHLAAPEIAARFAGATSRGLTAEEICTAITSASLKLGRHARARINDPRAMTALADHVGSFIANQRKLTATAPASPAGDPAVERFLDRWRRAYARAEGSAYTAGNIDARSATEIVVLSRRAAQEASTSEDTTDLADKIADHWIGRYLEDEGTNGYLAKARHPLHYLARHVGTYGLPRAEMRAEAARSEPAPIEEPAMSSADRAERLAGALRAIGGAGPTIRKCEARTATPSEEDDACSA